MSACDTHNVTYWGATCPECEKKGITMEDRCKFRVWLKRAKQMVSDPGDPCMPRLEADGVLGVSYDHIDVTNDVVFMQCTGIIDDPGDPIYEGDIVKHLWAHCADYSVVAWGGPWGYAGFGLTGKRIRPRGADDSPEYWDNLNPTWSSDIMIVGNIHENPELLEKS